MLSDVHHVSCKQVLLELRVTGDVHAKSGYNPTPQIKPHTSTSNQTPKETPYQTNEILYVNYF